MLLGAHLCPGAAAASGCSAGAPPAGRCGWAAAPGLLPHPLRPQAAAAAAAGPVGPRQRGACRLAPRRPPRPPPPPWRRPLPAHRPRWRHSAPSGSPAPGLHNGRACRGAQPVWWLKPEVWGPCCWTRVMGCHVAGPLSPLARLGGRKHGSSSYIQAAAVPGPAVGSQDKFELGP